METITETEISTTLEDRPFTSDPQTLAMRAHVDHIREVQLGMGLVICDLLARQIHHDETKFSDHEWPLFAEQHGTLRTSTYGSEEYKAGLAKLGPALAHHYENNTHHPEYYADGIRGMSLLDLIEMLADWRAAVKRHADGSLDKSLAHNKGRFEISDDLAAILENTCRDMGWI